MALLPVGLLQRELDLEVRGSSTETSETGPTSTQPEPTSDSPSTSVLMMRAEDERHGRYRQYGPHYGSHQAEAEEVASGHGIFL